MRNPADPLPGRGSSANIKNRCETQEIVFDVTDDEEDRPSLKTRFFKDSSQSIVNSNNSPDVGFDFSVNPYRGCEHGCAYCFARPTHEFLGMSAGLDFESKIFVKEDAPSLLRKKLMSKSWKPAVIAMSGVTDCYQPAERKFRLTRGCLEVLAEFRNPVAMITKNALITRDIDLFKELASFNAVLISISLTSLDSDLCGILEPRTSRPAARLKAIEELSKAGIPVNALLAPMIPGLNDHEMPKILKAAANAGARHAGFVPLRLPLAVAPLFTQWLEQHKPERKEKVLNHIKDMRGGLLNNAEFGERMRGQGPFAENLRQMFKVYCTKEGFNEHDVILSTEHFRVPAQTGDQFEFF